MVSFGPSLQTDGVTMAASSSVCVCLLDSAPMKSDRGQEDQQMASWAAAHIAAVEPLQPAVAPILQA